MRIAKVGRCGEVTVRCEDENYERSLSQTVRIVQLLSQRVRGLLGRIAARCEWLGQRPALATLGATSAQFPTFACTHARTHDLLSTCEATFTSPFTHKQDPRCIPAPLTRHRASVVQLVASCAGTTTLHAHPSRTSNTHDT